jgi:hypothetical protein
MYPAPPSVGSFHLFVSIAWPYLMMGSSEACVRAANDKDPIGLLGAYEFILIF